MKTRFIFLFMILVLAECKTISHKLDDKKNKSKAKAKTKTIKVGNEVQNDKEIMKKKDANTKFEEDRKKDVEMLLNTNVPIGPRKLQFVLSMACIYNAYKYIDICLKRGADPNKINKETNSFSAVQYVLENPHYNENLIKSLEVLCKYRDMPNNPLKPKFNTLGVYGSPTSFCLIKYKEEHIKKLLKFGIDIHATNKEGYNVLYCAVEAGRYNMIPFFESFGLKWDVNINPLAKKYGNENCVIVWGTPPKYRGKYIYLDYFVRKGIDSSRLEWEGGKSVLHLAAKTRIWL